MARTIEEIYTAMVLDKESRPELAGLTSVSKTALWRMWLYVVATAIHVHEQFFDAFKKEAEEIAARAIPGSLRWYADRAREFQYGYNLVMDLQRYIYYYLDTTSDAAIAAKIIAQVSVQEVFTSTFSGVRVKAAKLSGTDLVKLSSAELTAFEFYMHRIRFAGVAMDVISTDADEVKMNVKVYYDGVLPLAAVQLAFETALKDHLKAIPFDGVLNRNALIDAFQAMPEVFDVELLSLQAKPAAGSFWNEVVRSYSPTSGYYMPVLIDCVFEFIPE